MGELTRRAILLAGGGIVGGILCGLISDKLGKRAVVAAVSMAFAIPAMAVYRSVVTGPQISDGVNGGLMFVAGTFSTKEELMHSRGFNVAILYDGKYGIS